VEDFSEPACAIVKHNNPCGCALGESALQAYERAFACDPMSAYGGVIALNRRVDLACAQALSGQFIEVLIAPGYDADALELLGEKKNVRLLELPLWPALARLSDIHGRPLGGVHNAPMQAGLEQKPVLGGVLSQSHDTVSETREQMRVMGITAPTDQQWDDLLFAWKVCRHVRSNAIVIAREGATVGIGAGQMSRVDAVRIAIEKAQAAEGGSGSGGGSGSEGGSGLGAGPEAGSGAGAGPEAGSGAGAGSEAGSAPDSRTGRLAGASLASDAFFPFADGPQLAIAAGVTAIIQPGGSVRDEEVVAAADAEGVAMVATGIRHFRH
jgi:phosphoribosylaminoimidazolecarboxamide formyltransferase / IMP cyclohydrolase